MSYEAFSLFAILAALGLAAFSAGLWLTRPRDDMLNDFYSDLERREPKEK